MDVNKYINKAITFAFKKLGKQVTLQSLPKTKDIITLCDVEHQSAPSAIYLPSHLSRFLSSSIYYTLEGEFKRLFATEVEHFPTLMIPFQNSVVYQYGIVNSKLEHLPRNRNNSQMLPQPSNTDYGKMKNALLIDTDYSELFFGHWLPDELSAATIANEQLPAIAIHQANFIHAKGYLDLLQTDIYYGFKGKVDNLNLLVDFSQNSFKVSRYGVLRKRLENKNFTTIAYKGVYISRGNIGAKRTLENEDDLVNHLIKAGFDVIYPEKLQPHEIVARLWNAPMIISVEGSAIAHALYTVANHGSILILQPPRRINHVFKGIFDAKNNPYGFYVCKPSAHDKESFYLDSFSDLDKLIDQLREETAKRVNTNF